jgi:hypothetical protein
MRPGAPFALKTVIIVVLAAGVVTVGTGVLAILYATRLSSGDVGSIGSVEVDLFFGAGLIGAGALLLIVGAVAYGKWIRSRSTHGRRLRSW